MAYKVHVVNVHLNLVLNCFPMVLQTANRSAGEAGDEIIQILEKVKYSCT